MIEHQKAVGNHEDRVRHSKLIGGRFAYRRLEKADNVKANESHRSAGKGREFRNFDKPVSIHQAVQLFQRIRIGLEAAFPPLLLDQNRSPATLEINFWITPQKRVTPDLIVPLGRLKQERAGPVIDLLKNRDRSFVVSNKLGIDRDQISLPGKFGKFLLRWEKWDRGHGRCGAAEAQGVRVSQG